MQVLGISGSLRGASHNSALVRSAADLLPPGAELELWGGLREVPPFDQDHEAEAPHGVRELRAAITGADALLIATPEYNHSVPGQLKNALDWASRPYPDGVLRGKPVLVVGASTGMFGAVWAQAELRKALSAAGARVVDGELPVGLAPDRFGDDGLLADPDLRRHYMVLLAELAQAAAPAVAAAA